MSGKSIPSLTGIRGIAALLVVSYHLPMREIGAVPTIISNSDRGVDLFFILSGFILAYVHAREFERPSLDALKSFFIVRFFRVYPLHFVVLMSTLAFILANPEFVKWARSLPPDPMSGEAFSVAGFFQTLTLTNRVGLSPLGAWNVPSWSLSSEIAGYVAFPILAYALMRVRNINLCYGAAVFCLASFCLIIKTRGHIGVARMALCFTAGMALGRAKELQPQYALLAPTVTTISAAAAIAFLSSASLNALSVFAFAGLIYGLSLGPSTVNSFLSSAPVMFLGQISFSLYLTHFNLLNVMIWSIGSTAYPVLKMLSMTTVFIIVATASFYLIEKPSHAIGRRLGHRTTKHLGTAVA